MSGKGKVADSVVEQLRSCVQTQGLFLEDVSLVKAGKHSRLVITVDLQDGNELITSEEIAEVTRSLSSLLDEIDPIAGEYRLEVSSPGAERTLHTARHFRRVEGRKIRVLDHHGEEFRGILEVVDDDSVKLVSDQSEQVYALSEIKTAQVLVEF